MFEHCLRRVYQQFKNKILVPMLTLSGYVRNYDYPHSPVFLGQTASFGSYEGNHIRLVDAFKRTHLHALTLVSNLDPDMDLE